MQLNKIGYFEGFNKANISITLIPSETLYPKEKVLRYLKAGIEVYSWLEHVNCMYSCKNKNLGSTEYSDGVWVWTREFIHYVEDHSITIPETFLTYLKKCNYNIIDSEDLTTLRKIQGDPNLLQKNVTYKNNFWKTWLYSTCPNFEELESGLTPPASTKKINPNYEIPDDW